MLPLTKVELKLQQDATNCYVCGKRILFFNKSKNHGKVRITAIIPANIEGKHIVFAISNLMFQTKAQAMIIILS